MLSGFAYSPIGAHQQHAETNWKWGCNGYRLAYTTYLLYGLCLFTVNGLGASPEGQSDVRVTESKQRQSKNSNDLGWYNIWATFPMPISTYTKATQTTQL